MKIKYCVFSSNSDRKYLDFWPKTRDLWIRMNIIPIFVFIGEEDKVIDRGNYIIRKIKKINNYDDGFQSQISRLFITKYYPNESIITSDVDMLPISENYFRTTVEKHPEDSFICMSSDGYDDDKQIRNYGKVPICYNVGLGKTFAEILDLECDFKTFCARLWENHPHWDSDEKYLAKKLGDFREQHRIIRLKRGFTHGSEAIGRIDRADWCVSEFKFKTKRYVDCHSVRPYKRYKKEIDELINFIYKYDY